MKEKRYICDYIEAMPVIVMILILIITILIGWWASYNVIFSKYDNELNADSESIYQYLEEVADKVVKEGNGIDLLKLPDDIVGYNITTTDSDGIVKFTYYMNKGQLFFQPIMTVELSGDNFKIISKRTSYPLIKEDYVREVRIRLILYSVIIGIIPGVILSVTCEVIQFCSSMRKRKAFHKV